MKEGLFRIPGRMTDILEMKISFEQGALIGMDIYVDLMCFIIYRQRIRCRRARYIHNRWFTGAIF